MFEGQFFPKQPIQFGDGAIGPFKKIGVSRTWSFVGSTTSSTSSINISGTGLAAGDLCLYFDRAEGSSGIPTAVTPSGFTNGHNTGVSAGSDMRMMISAKKLVGSEGAITGINGSSSNRKIAMVFRPSIAFTGFTFSGPSNQITDSNPTGQTIATSGAGTSVLAFGQMGNAAASGAVSPRTTSPTMTEIGGTDTHHYAHYLAQAVGALSNISYDMDDEGDTNGIQSGYLTFT